MFPAASVATKVSTVVPTGNALPLANPEERAVVTPEQLSVPTGATNEATVVQVDELLFAVILFGQVIIGKVESTTTTENEQVAEFPKPSLAV